MAVFMLNVCKFNACGLTFKNLGHLIQHIEETHIDYDPHVVEQSEQQQPTCIPLSYALRFLTDAARQGGLQPIHQGRAKQTTFMSQNRNKNVTPTGSEAEEGEDFTSEPEDSNDSWTTSEEFSADYILRYGSRVVSQSIITHSNNSSVVNNNNNNNNNNIDKPFACPVPGCKKRYKNINGIKYHSKNGHKNDGKIRKAFKCSCGKSYKTTYGLKNHAAMQHNSNITGLNIRTSIQSNKQQQLTKSGNENENITSSLGIVVPSKVSKTKIPAIEDHGYIKSERSVLTETEIECDNDLGILTPASTPPLALHNVNKSDQLQQQQQPIAHQARTLNKCFAATSNNVNNSTRRSINNIKNDY